MKATEQLRRDGGPAGSGDPRPSRRIAGETMTDSDLELIEHQLNLLAISSGERNELGELL